MSWKHYLCADRLLTFFALAAKYSRKYRFIRQLREVEKNYLMQMKPENVTSWIRNKQKLKLPIGSIMRFEINCNIHCNTHASFLRNIMHKYKSFCSSIGMTGLSRNCFIFVNTTYLKWRTGIYEYLYGIHNVCILGAAER